MSQKILLGPELDAEISHKVFGKKWNLHEYVIINGVREDVPTWMKEPWTPENPGGGVWSGAKPPGFSENLELAWSVVENLRGNLKFRISFAQLPLGLMTAKAVAEAICQTALTALEE